MTPKTRTVIAGTLALLEQGHCTGVAARDKSGREVWGAHQDAVAWCASESLWEAARRIVVIDPDQRAAIVKTARETLEALLGIKSLVEANDAAPDLLRARIRALLTNRGLTNE